MLLRKVKRKRPTLADADQWLKEGSYFVCPKEHFLSEEETDTFVDEIVEALENIPTNFPRTSNLEFAVLKGHLILERMIVMFIRFHAGVRIDSDDIKFTFSQKLEVAYLMGFGTNSPTLLPTIQLWNRARNQVAHNLKLETDIIDRLIRINSDGECPPSTDRQRISALRRFCFGTCGYLSGQIRMTHLIQSRKASSGR